MSAKIILGCLLAFLALFVRPKGTATSVAWMLSMVAVAALLVVLEVFK